MRRLIDAFRTADVAAIETSLAPDVVWHFPGREGALAGEHRGRDAVFEFLAKVMNLTEGTFVFDLVDIVANDERAIVLFRGSARRQERKLDNPTCLVIELHDGQATTIWEYVWDLEHVETFWR